MHLNDGGYKEIAYEIHRTVAKAVRDGSAFDSVAVSLQNSEIIARNFRIRIYNSFIGSQGKKGIPGQIRRFKGQGSEAVCNRGIVPHGKIRTKTVRAFGCALAHLYSSKECI